MISVGEISCYLGAGAGAAAAAAALYLIGRSCRREADELKTVTRVNQLKDLSQLLDAESRGLPLLVAVCGRVGSDKPIKCENSGLRVVVLERTIEQQYEKRSDAGSWVKDSALLLSRRREVNWYLDDGTSHVDVVGARGAEGLVLTVGSDVFEKSRPGTLDNIPGLKILGIREVERVLPTGKLLTVVGEAVKDNIGSIRIQRPRNGPFYVSDKTIDDLMTNFPSCARFCTYASVGLTGGIFLLAKHAIQHILERRRKRVLDAAKKFEQEEAGLNDKAGNKSDYTSRDRTIPDLCVTCLELEYNPCGHICSCVACSSHLINCPLCREQIGQVGRTFRH